MPSPGLIEVTNFTNDAIGKEPSKLYIPKATTDHKDDGGNFFSAKWAVDCSAKHTNTDENVSAITNSNPVTGKIVSKSIIINGLKMFLILSIVNILNTYSTVKTPMTKNSK